MSDLKANRQAVDRARREHEEARHAYRKEKKALAGKKRHLAAVQEAVETAQTVAQQLQTIVHERISSIVSQCLSDIFDEAVEFRVIWDKKRGKTEGRLAFIRHDREIDPLSSDGGSAVEVASFALRLAKLVLSPDGVRKFIALDEPFLALSERHAKRVQKMIMVLSKELDIQILLITHNPHLRAGKVITVP